MSPMRYIALTGTTSSETPVGGAPTIRVRIDQDTVLPTLSTAAASITATSAASVQTATPLSRGMSTGTKVGLGMIPVVVVMVGLYVLFLFWYRKRRTARKQSQGSKAPPVPEKDGLSYNSSIASRRGSSKVFRMAAFSAPVHDGRHHEAHFQGQSAAILEVAPENKDRSVQVQMAAAPLRSPGMGEADLDSPIDGSSPFRLKRGDTVKRCSLGPELARLWPSPPTSAWMKPLNTDDRLPEPVVRRESFVYQQRPVRNQR